MILPSHYEPSVSPIYNRRWLAEARNRAAGGTYTMSESKVIANQQTIIKNQKTIIANQAALRANQTAIKKNQASILKNQAGILRNQGALKTIVENQKEILARLSK
jgi:hypothetical protein